MNREDLGAALADTVDWWRNTSTGEIRGTINYQLYDELDSEDQCWCELAGIVQVDPTQGRLPTSPRYPPGLSWIWSRYVHCWWPSDESWQRISKP